MRLCVACAELTQMTGAGIMLVTDDVPRGSVCTSDQVSAVIEELQFTLGEGPCVDAHRLRHPVVEGDLVDPSAPRWPAFTPPAIEAGVRAVFGFPIAIGEVRLGALNLYRNQPGHLTIDQHANALVAAGVAARAIVGMQAGAAPDVLGAELEVGPDFRLVVHQAAGMVSVQLGVPVAEALVRLRAHSFSCGRTVTDVARDVVARHLSFGGDDDPGSRQSEPEPRRPD